MTTHVQRGPGWEAATRPVPPQLRHVIRSWCGYVERTSAKSVRIELPHPQVVMIFEIGPPIRVAGVASQGGFVAGLEDRPTRCEHDGMQAGVQVNLTPIGARLLFARPMTELTGRVIALRDLLTREERSIPERLAEAPTWDARFDLVERTLTARIASTRTDIRAISWAMDRIESSGGTLAIASMSQALGYSHKHVIAMFRESIGLAPKAFAAIVRFDRVVRHVRAGHPGSWAELAHGLGFSDQAHLSREVRRLSGKVPTELRKELLGESFPVID